MKKILSLALALVMLASMLVVTVNAVEPFGTIVEVPYSATAPSMDAASPDASWGEKIITVDKNTPNAAITQYIQRGVPDVRQDITFDLYAKWTDLGLYLCFVSPDPDIVGGPNYYSGDGFQLAVYPGILDISYCNGVSTGWTDQSEYLAFDWTLTLYFDDESIDGSDNAIEDGVVYVDLKNNALVVKFYMPFTSIGFGKKEVVGEGSYISFSMIRGECNADSYPGCDNGYLEWGDFYNSKKGWPTTDPALYIACCDNTKTTTANTFKLVGAGSSAPVEEKPEEKPETPVTPVVKGEPSSWAKDEVDKAIAEGLVPEELQTGYTDGISRANLSKILSKLLDKVYGKDAEKAEASFTDTTDADVLKAANLGIINGYKQADGTYKFKPENTLKRSEMSAIINRVAKLCGKTTEGFDSEVTFTDTASHWCNGELGWPVHNGIVKGTSATTFSPENTLTVEQTIMMVYRTFEALK